MKSLIVGQYYGIIVRHEMKTSRTVSGMADAAEYSKHVEHLQEQHHNGPSHYIERF